MTTVVRKNTGASCGFRIGTAVIPRNEIFQVLGHPDVDCRGDSDEKVTLVWRFETPRGQVEIRDYWWNAIDEWSIAAANRKAALHVARHLRKLGYAASTRFGRRSDCRTFGGAK